MFPQPFSNIPKVNPDRITNTNLADGSWTIVCPRYGNDAVQATHRVGGNLDANNNYFDITLGSRFPGAVGNSVQINIAQGSSNTMEVDEHGVIQIRHAANSLAGVKTAVDAGPATIGTAGDIVGQGAQVPAGYTEHGTFSGGVDAVDDIGRLAVLQLSNQSSWAGIRLADISETVADGANAEYYIRSGTQMVFRVSDEQIIRVKRNGNTAVRVACQEYWGDWRDWVPQGHLG